MSNHDITNGYTALADLELSCSHCGKGPDETRLEEWRIGELTCPACIDRIIRADESARELESDCVPGWFDPAYAGERWEDDY